MVAENLVVCQISPDTLEPMDPTMDTPMDLRYTDAQEAFREEARTWLSAHAPAPHALPSLDTAEGFEAHRAWERTSRKTIPIVPR